MPSGFKDAASKRNFLDALSGWMGGANRHKPAVLEHGIEPKRLGLTAEEAQFLETRKELWLDLTRIWRIPPHKVGILDRATFSNIEEQSLDFVISTLRPFLELIERSIDRFLLDEDGVLFEFNVESILRGNTAARFNSYALARQWGWMSVNDIRRAENDNGIGPAGDRYIEPMNMVPVGAEGSQRDEGARDGVRNAVAFMRETAGNQRRRALKREPTRLEVIDNVA